MKKLFVFMTSVLLLLGSTIAYAQETVTKAGTCEFTGKKMVSSFDSTSIAVSVAEMEPGDAVSFEVDIANNSKIATDWYMSNTVINSLEDAQSVAENGGYTYILNYTPEGGSPIMIYSSSTVGGDSDELSSEAHLGHGLYEATNSLDDFFYVASLDPDATAKVSLYVSLDGESQGNIYQDTLAKLMMNFAVETPTETIKTRKTNKVQTGDVFLWGAVILLGLGIFLLFFGFLKNRKNRNQATATALGLAVLLSLVLSALAPTSINAQTNYTYTVTISTGNHATFSDISSIQVKKAKGNEGAVKSKLNSDKTKITVTGLEYGDILSCASQSAVMMKEGSKYYVKGIRLSGRDNNTVSKSAFTVVEDQDYVIAYGIPGDLTEYTVHYQDDNGNEIAKSQTFYGNIGDEPVIAYRYIEGYVPSAYNMSVVLSADASENVFYFEYYAAGENVIIVDDDDNPNGENQNGQNQNGENQNGQNQNGENQNGQNPNGEDDDIIVIPDDDTPESNNGSEDGPDDPGANEKKEINDDETPKSSNNPIQYLNERGILIPCMMGIITLGLLIVLLVVFLVRKNKKVVVTEQNHQKKDE